MIATNGAASHAQRLLSGKPLAGECPLSRFGRGVEGEGWLCASPSPQESAGRRQGYGRRHEE